MGRRIAKNTAIRFPVALHQELSEAARDREISLNTLVVKLCEYGLPKLSSPKVNLFKEEASTDA